MAAQDLVNRFSYHPATEITGPKHEMIRTACLDLAKFLDSVIPEGREKSLAITHLEETMMWSNAGIARNG